MRIYKQILGNVTTITISKDNGFMVSLSTLGASIYDLKTKDRNNNIESIVLYPTDINEFYNSDGYYGKTVGRFSGRIDNAKCMISGKEYILEKNWNGVNSLHGGYEGISFQNFEYEIEEQEDLCRVIFTYLEKENILPGDVSYKIIYEINKNIDEINVVFNATTNKETIVNLTNHTYFNLSGDLKNTVMNQYLKLYCDKYTNLNNDLITISIDPVNDVFDFRNMHEIGKYINDESIQNHIAKGYDHCWLKDDLNEALIAELYDEASGRRLSVRTSYPAIVCYAGCYPKEFDFNHGVKIQKHHSICLECQFVPNGINMNDVDKAILKPGEIYNHYINYRFETEK